MISWLKIPSGQYFARNPIRFKVSTNKYLIDPAVKQSITLAFTNTGPADGDSFVVLVDGVMIEIGFINTAPPENDQTNYRIRQGAQSLGNWVAQFANALKNNFLLMSYFEIERSLTIIQLVSKRDFNVNFINNASNTLPLIGNTPEDAVYRDNFKLLCDVTVEETYRAGDFKYAGTLVHEPDSDSQTWFDVAPLVLPYLGYDLPPLSYTLNRAVVCENVNKRYNVLIREEYGETPVVQTAKSSDNSRGGWAQRGGFAPEHFDIDYTLDVDADGTKQIFQTWCPEPKPTTPTQPEYLFFRNINADIQRVKLTLYFNDGTSTAYTNHISNFMLNAEYNDVVYFRSDYVALGIAPLVPSGKRVSRYKVELTDTGNTVLYLGMTYRVDHRHYEYGRYLVFQNSWGAMETVLIKHSLEMQETIERELSTKVLEYDYSAQEGELIEFESNSNTSYATSTGFYSREYIEYLRELLRNNKNIFLIMDDEHVRVNLQGGTYDISRDEQNLYALNLNLNISFNKKTYSTATGVEAATQTTEVTGGGTGPIILPGG